MELGENNEQRTTVSSLNDEILMTYPFLNDEEKKVYEVKSNEILAHKTSLEPLEAVKKLLELLHNPHADIREAKEVDNNKHPKEPELNMEDGILYIRVPTWDKRLDNIPDDLIRYCDQNKDNYKAVIIDVRGNGGGSSLIAHRFAGIFFKENVPYGRFIKRIKGNGLEEEEAIMPANGKVYIEKPLAILISNKCFSSNELFLAPFKTTGRAVLIGERTAGGSGNPVEIDIGMGGKKYNVRIPTWRFVLGGETKPIEETAITPDIVDTQGNIASFAKMYLEEQFK